MPQHAAVVGSGLVGSLMSIFLARRGFEVDVYERRSDMRRAGYMGGRSINLAMSHRGWKALEAAGIAEEIRSVGIPMYGRMIHDRTGKLAYQPYGKEGQAIFSVSRGGLNRALLDLADAFPNVHYHFEHVCEDYDLSSGLLRFSVAGGGQVEKKPDLVLGTDGAFSAVRLSMMKRPGFNFSQTYLEHGYKELTIPAGPNGAFRLEKNALHIWPRGNFMMIALPNPDGSFTCTLFMPMEGDIAFEQLNTPAEVETFFADWFADSLPLIDRLTEEFFENPTSHLVTVKCEPWNFGNALLIGDAAHAIVPFYGQGMNAGFEDCTLLDAMMDDWQGDWSGLFREFSRHRVKDGNAIAELAQRNFVEMRDLVADPMFLLRKKIAANLDGKVPAFMPVYSMVSFSSTPYSEALLEDDRQNHLFSRILAMPQIEERWDSPEVEAAVRDFYGG
jgi:kynurenine 3-monooxygenase